MAEGAKYDNDKAPFSLMWDGMPNALEGVVKVLGFGASKYAAHSWQQVPNNIERYQAALLRHQNAIAKGETHDPESGLPHDFHVACNALFLAELRHRERVQRSHHLGAGNGESQPSAKPVPRSDGGTAGGIPEAPVSIQPERVRGSSPVTIEGDPTDPRAYGGFRTVFGTLVRNDG